MTSIKSAKDPIFNEAVSYALACRKWKKDREYAVIRASKLYDVKRRDLAAELDDRKGPLPGAGY